MFYAALALAPLLMILGLIARRFEKPSRSTIIPRMENLSFGVGAAVQMAAVVVMAFSTVPNVREGAFTAWLTGSAFYAIDGVIVIRMRLLQIRDRRIRDSTPSQ